MKYLFVAVLLICALVAEAQVTAQWRGPERDGIYQGENLLTQWPADGPAMLWNAQGIGTGYSSAVCDGKSIFVTGMKGKEDVMTCLSTEGKTIWQTPMGEAFDGPFPDTRTTPTVDGDRVYEIGRAHV